MTAELCSNLEIFRGKVCNPGARGLKPPFSFLLSQNFSERIAACTFANVDFQTWNNFWQACKFLCTQSSLANNGSRGAIKVNGCEWSCHLDEELHLLFFLFFVPSVHAHYKDVVASLISYLTAPSFPSPFDFPFPLRRWRCGVRKACWCWGNTCLRVWMSSDKEALDNTWGLDDLFLGKKTAFLIRWRQNALFWGCTPQNM